MPSYATQQPDRRLRIPISMLGVVLERCVTQRQNVIVHGGVGIGKTSVVAQTACKLGLTMDTFIVGYRESTDLTGVPWTMVNPDTGEMETHWAVPNFVTRLRKAAALAAQQNKPHMVFWDELNRVDNINTLNAAAQAIHESNFGDHYVPNLVHVAAVNDAAESTGTTQMPDQLRNRAIHIYVVAEPQGWLTWARAGNLLGPGAPNVIAYINDHPDHLYAPDRKSDAFPTPRVWEFLSNVLDPALPRDAENALIYGAIGPAHGEQFVPMLHLQRTMASRYSLAKILQNPTTEPVPAEVSAQYAIAAALSSLMTVNNGQAACTYLARMSAEMQTFAMLGAYRRTGGQASPLFDVPAFSRWIGANAGDL